MTRRDDTTSPASTSLRSRRSTSAFAQSAATRGAGASHGRGGRRGPLLLAAVLCGPLLSSCYIDTQRYSGMIRPTVDPLPGGALNDFARGPEQATVVRLGDTVSVRIAESLSTVKLRWYDKRIRVPSGSWVFCSASGMAEVYLPGTTVVTLNGQGAGVVGAAESRREPEFFFLDLTSAQVDFGEPGRVQLPGGALLEASAGIFVLERVDTDVLRVANRTGTVGTVSYRDAVITLQPSKSVDLALLDVGTAPYERDPRTRNVLTDGGRLELRGDVDVLTSNEGARLRAGEAAEISGFGQILRLDPGDEVLFEGLGDIDQRRALAEAAAEGR